MAVCSRRIKGHLDRLTPAEILCHFTKCEVGYILYQLKTSLAITLSYLKSVISLQKVRWLCFPLSFFLIMVLCASIQSRFAKPIMTYASFDQYQEYGATYAVLRYEGKIIVIPSDSKQSSLWNPIYATAQHGAVLLGFLDSGIVPATDMPGKWWTPFGLVDVTLEYKHSFHFLEYPIRTSESDVVTSLVTREAVEEVFRRLRNEGVCSMDASASTAATISRAVWIPGVLEFVYCWALFCFIFTAGVFIVRSASSCIRRARWRAVGQCEHCGFDLRGLLGNSACPECGRSRP